MDKDELIIYIFFVSVGLTPAGTICYLSRNVLISILGGYPRGLSRIYTYDAGGYPSKTTRNYLWFSAYRKLCSKNVEITFPLFFS